jgi:hypothetical protein
MSMDGFEIANRKVCTYYFLFVCLFVCFQRFTVDLNCLYRVLLSNHSFLQIYFFVHDMLSLYIYLSICFLLFSLFFSLFLFFLSIKLFCVC